MRTSSGGDEQTKVATLPTSWCWLVCGLLLLCTTSVRAESEQTLRWRAPPGCPTLQQAEAGLVALTGDERALQRGHARVVIDRAPTGELRARITLLLESGDEARELLGRGCADLSDAALLIIGLALEGEPVRELVTPAAAPASPHRSALALGALLGLDVGSLSGATLGVGGALRLRRAWWLGELEAQYFLPVQRTAAAARSELGLSMAVLRTGYLFRASPDPHEARLCPFVSAGLELGAARGRGVDTRDDQSATGMWVGVLLGVGAALGPYHRLHPLLRAELGLPLRSPSFDLEGGTRVFQAQGPLVRFALRLDLELL